MGEVIWGSAPPTRYLQESRKSFTSLVLTTADLERLKGIREALQVSVNY